MSVHSNHYESEDEYLRDLHYEYRTEQAGLYHYDDDEPEEKKQCGDCVHCRRGLGYTRSIVSVQTGEELEEGKQYGKYGVTMHVNRKPTAEMYLCCKALDNIIQINDYDEACEDFKEA